MEIKVKNRRGVSYFDKESLTVGSLKRGTQSKGLTVADLQNAISKASSSKLRPERQRITFEGKVLSQPTAKLSDLGITDHSEVTLKDLGPQIGWRTVFYVEYFGPILIHVFIFFFPQYAYFWLPRSMVAAPQLSSLSVDYFRYQLAKGHNLLQTLTFVLILLHFIKREMETAFVHRFSHGTMPLRNLFKNSGHYWILSGVLIAYGVYYPESATAKLPVFVQRLLQSLTSSPAANSFRLVAWTLLWAYSQVSNLITHIILRNLRPPGSTERRIPLGYGFSLVSCPNYWFEVTAWLSLCFLTGNIFVWIFTAVSFAQMAVWAEAKHRNYQKTFGDKYPRRRKIMVPFIW